MLAALATCVLLLECLEAVCSSVEVSLFQMSHSFINLQVISQVTVDGTLYSLHAPTQQYTAPLKTLPLALAFYSIVYVYSSNRFREPENNMIWPVLIFVP